MVVDNDQGNIINSIKRRAGKKKIRKSECTDGGKSVTGKCEGLSKSVKGTVKICLLIEGEYESNDASNW